MAKRRDEQRTPAAERERVAGHDPERRRFLRAAAAGLAGGGAALAAGCEYRTQLFLLDEAPIEAEVRDDAWQESRVRSYRTLGKTGMKMSDIAFGTSGLDNVSVVKRALERGVNYYDTSPDYSRAGSERILGEGIKGHPRDQLFIVSKFCTPDGHLGDDVSPAEVIAAVEGSLQRLGTDYLDLAHIHACNSLDRLMNPNIHEAAERLKEQGKLRFVGVSSHTPQLELVMREAVASGKFDVIMVAYNFNNWPDLTNIFRDAHDKGVGVVAMKTLKGAQHTVLSDFTPTERESFAQAAFKWVLANPHVSGLVVSINTLGQVDEYLAASGQKPTGADVALLERYDRLVSADYCRPGCGICLSSCPHGVPIDDVLRFAMYYESYGQQRVAMEEYARIPATANASRCVECAAPCQPACPFELPINRKLRAAHELLRLA